MLHFVASEKNPLYLIANRLIDVMNRYQFNNVKCIGIWSVLITAFISTHHCFDVQLCQESPANQVSFWLWWFALPDHITFCESCCNGLCKCSKFAGTSWSLSVILSGVSQLLANATVHERHTYGTARRCCACALHCICALHVFSVKAGCCIVWKLHSNTGRLLLMLSCQLIVIAFCARHIWNTYSMSASSLIRAVISFQA